MTEHQAQQKEIDDLRIEIKDLRDQIIGFNPLDVDLRINGVIQKVTIFARPEIKTIFNVVK